LLLLLVLSISLSLACVYLLFQRCRCNWPVGCVSKVITKNGIIIIIIIIIIITIIIINICSAISTQAITPMAVPNSKPHALYPLQYGA
jgi:hypothetical protein